MRIIEVSEQSFNMGQIFAYASRENVILKTPDGKEFVLAEVDSFDREVELTRQNQELADFLDQRSEEHATFTLEQVKRQLNMI